MRPKIQFLSRIADALKAFSGVGTALPFSLAGFTATLRKRSVETDPMGNYAGWVYAALSKRAKRIGAIDLHLYELNSKMDVEEVFDHDVLALLHRANPLQSKYQFFYTIEMFLGIWGSAPILKDRAGGRAITYLWPLRPDLLKAQSDNNGKIISYEYRVAGRVSKFAAEDVVVINEPNPQNLALGFSPMSAASLEIDVDMQAALWNKYLLENFSEPGGVLTTEQAIDDKSFERLKKEWAQRHAGPMNAGRWALLEKGLKAEPIGRSPKDMDMVESRRFHRNAITAILGVPMALMTSEDVNLANAEAAERVFAKDTVEPEMTLIVGTFNEFLVPEFADNLELDFTSPVPEDVAKKVNTAAMGEGRWLTVNEARDMFDLAPLDGGDAIYKPLGVFPQVGDASGSNDPAEDPAAPKGFPTGTKFEKITVGKRPDRLARRKSQIKARILARTHFKRKVIEGIKEKTYANILKKMDHSSHGKVRVSGIRIVDSSMKAKSVKEDAPEWMDPRIKAERIEFLKRLPRAQKTFSARMQGYFGQQSKEVLKNLKAEGLPKGRNGGIPATKSIDRWINKILFDQKTNDDLLVAMAGEMYRDNISTGSQAVARLLGLDPSDILATPFVIDFISDRSFLMLSVNKTTKDALRTSLAEGVAQGEDLGQIRERITSIYDEAQDFRAETISRTEVGAAQNFGRTAEMENQKVEKKVWIATFSNTRDAHAEADGQVREVDETFTVGGESLEYPGDPSGSAGNTINCQCSVSPTLK